MLTGYDSERYVSAGERIRGEASSLVGTYLFVKAITFVIMLFVRPLIYLYWFVIFSLRKSTSRIIVKSAKEKERDRLAAEEAARARFLEHYDESFGRWKNSEEYGRGRNDQE